MAPVLGLAGLLTALRPTILGRAWRATLPFSALILAFLAWACVSTFWSIYPDHGQSPRLLATALPGLALAAAAGADARTRRFLRAAGLASALVLIVMLVVETFGIPINRAAQGPDVLDWMLERNPGRGVSFLAAVVWAVAAGLLAAKPRGWIAWLVLVALGAAYLAGQFHQAANLAAMGLGAAAFAAGLAAPRAALVILAAVLAAWLLGAPFLTPLLFGDPAFIATLPDPVAVRVETWKYTSDLIVERPWIGYGLDASRSFTETAIIRGGAYDLMPLHPHSASLQIWLETGAVGAVLGAAALIAGGLAMARALARRRAQAAAACGAMAAIGVLANVSYGAWQEWWVATACIAAALVCAVRAEPPSA